jgi:hypothetical protein
MKVIEYFIQNIYGTKTFESEDAIQDFNMMKEVLINSSVKIGMTLRYYPFMVNSIIEEIVMCNHIQRIRQIQTKDLRAEKKK